MVICCRLLDHDLLRRRHLRLRCVPSCAVAAAPLAVLQVAVRSPARVLLAEVYEVLFLPTGVIGQSLVELGEELVLRGKH